MLQAQTQGSSSGMDVSAISRIFTSKTFNRANPFIFPFQPSSLSAFDDVEIEDFGPEDPLSLDDVEIGRSWGPDDPATAEFTFP